MDNINNKRIFSSFFWRFAERCGAQGVAFIVSIILARILAPEDYGTIALVTVFTTILNVFVDSGMGNALIQKKNADDLDFSTVFYFNIIVCILLYLGIFIISPVIASFYKRPDLTTVIRVLSLTLIVSGIKNVQQAYVSRNMLFQRFFFATLSGTVGAAIVGITMANLGFGVWALVGQQLFNIVIDTTILWFTVKWYPKRVFSLKRLRGLFQFGWKILISSLINTIYENLRTLIIGKVYSSSDLAYYNQGNKFPYVIVVNINSSIDSVLLPTMSAEQEHKEKVKNMTRKAIKISTYLMAPAMMGLVAISVPMITLVLTDKWLPCIPFLRVFCITYMFYPIHTANLNAINALGRSDLFLKLEIVKKVIGIIALFSTIWISVKAMAYSLLVVSFLSQIVNSWPNKYLLNYSYFEQLKDILPSISLALVMSVSIYPISFLHLPNIVIIMIQIILGVSIYIGGSKILKLDSFQYLWKIIKSMFAKRGSV